MVVTDLAVFTIDKHGKDGMALIEFADGVTLDQVKSKTEADFRVALKNAEIVRWARDSDDPSRRPPHSPTMPISSPGQSSRPCATLPPPAATILTPPGWFDLAPQWPERLCRAFGGPPSRACSRSCDPPRIS